MSMKLVEKSRLIRFCHREEMAWCNQRETSVT